MAVTLNEITKYIKHNNSELKYNLSLVSDFEQPQNIPKRIFDESKNIIETVDDGKINILKYKEDQIIDLPTFINDYFDLNEHYSYGVNEKNTFIYSLYYIIDNDFKLLSKLEQEQFVDNTKISILEEIEKNKIKLKAKVKAEINKNLYHETALNFLADYFKTNILIIDLNTKTYTLSNKVFNNELNCNTVFKSGDHFFPLINILGNDIKNNSCISIMKYCDGQSE